MRAIGCRGTRTAAAVRGVLAQVLVGGAGVLAGCGTIEPVASYAGPTTDPTQLYMSLLFNHPAVTLDTATGYETVQLTAVPHDAQGNPMSGLPVPTYSSTDTANVSVTPDGLVTARGVASGINVIARLAWGPVTRADTAVIDVTAAAPPPVLGSLSIHPVPPDSAIWPWQPLGTSGRSVGPTVLSVAGLIPNLTYLTVHTLAARALDTLGTAIPGLRVTYASLDSAVATVNRRSGLVTINRTGQVRLVARTLAYGITKADTAIFTIRSPVIMDIGVGRTALGTPAFLVPPSSSTSLPIQDIYLSQYGMILWTNYTGDSVDVTFDDPADIMAPADTVCGVLQGFIFKSLSPCGVGDVLIPPNPTPANPGPQVNTTARIRQFPVPGEYPYRSTRLGLTGKVVVRAN